MSVDVWRERKAAQRPCSGVASHVVLDCLHLQVSIASSATARIHISITSSTQLAHAGARRHAQAMSWPTHHDAVLLRRVRHLHAPSAANRRVRNVSVSTNLVGRVHLQRNRVQSKARRTSWAAHIGQESTTIRKLAQQQARKGNVAHNDDAFVEVVGQDARHLPAAHNRAVSARWCRSLS